MDSGVLHPDDFKHYFDGNNAADNDLHPSTISNADAWPFPRDNIVEVNPLVPEGTWDEFCPDRVLYHGRNLTMLYDKTGTRYHRGTGPRIFADGVEIGTAPTLTHMTANLPTLETAATPSADTAPGWVKYAGNPVMGGEYGTCFDISVLKEAPGFRMWLSWRPQKSVALVTSPDGLSWSGPPVPVLGPRPETGWEDDINRPVVVKREDGYHMWYTGQNRAHSAIGYATSPDGITWTRQSTEPVLSPDQPWEKVAVMCPDVTWDAAAQIYKMWYSGGDQYEPDAIGYATSPDGLHWTKLAQNPIFVPDPQSAWEQHKVTACQVIPDADGYTMLYIGFENVQHAQIGLARSEDGITGWVRNPANPIIRTSTRGSGNDWDCNACYKPFAVFDGTKWLLWYNGRRGSSATDGGGLEQIGVAIWEGEGLGF